MSGLLSEWKWAVLGDLISSIEAGKSFRCEERPPEGSEPGLVKISAVTKGLFNEDQSKTVLDLGRLDETARICVGDFLMSRANTIELVGACAVVDNLTRNLYLSDKVLRLRMPDEFKPWVMNWLRTERGRVEIEERSSGNQLSMRNIGQDSIRAIPIPLPPLPEQRRIVEKIKALTARSRRAREALDALPALIDRYRQSILAAAFSGDLTAEWRRSAEDAEAADTAFRKVGIAPSVECDDLPDLPVGWTWRRLGDVLESLRNGLPRKPENQPPGIPILRISAVRPFDVDCNQVRYYLADERDNVTSFLLRPGDILFTRYNGSADLVGVAGLYRGESNSVVYPDKLIRARIRAPELLLPEYLEATVNAGYTREFIRKSVKTSAGQHGIAGGDLKLAPIPIPPYAEQAIIVQAIRTAFGAVKGLEKRRQSTSDTLSTLDQSILAKAFRGELVPQDPNDEPASVLLERIRAERAAAGVAPRRGRRVRAE